MALSTFSSVVIALCFAAVFVTWTTWTYFIGSIWSPMPKRAIRQMLDYAKVGGKDVVYDLGSGDGRVVIEAAKRGASAFGVEIDPLRMIFSKLMVLLHGQAGKAKIEWKNIFSKTNDPDFKKATVVTLFLMQHANDMLQDTLRSKLRKGTKVVSYIWVFKGWKPTLVDKKNMIYLYTV